jgi:mannose-1-phosphate guanylyltransferase
MPVHGTPLLDYWLSSIKQIGIHAAIINLHHLKREVSEFIARPAYSSWVKTFEEQQLLGTAGTIRHLASQYHAADKTLLVIHADNWSHCDLATLLAHHEQAAAAGMLMTMMTFDTDTPEQCGIVVTDSNGTLQAFFEKSANPPGKRANAAVYVLEPAVIDWIRANPDVTDFSTEVIPEFIGQIACWHHEGVHRDIGTPQALIAAQRDPRHPLNPDTRDSWQRDFEKHPIHQMIEDCAVSQVETNLPT